MEKGKKGILSLGVAISVAFLISACGGGGGTGGGGGGETETGVTVDSVSDIPSLNIGDYYSTGSSSSSLSTLLAQTGLGSSCKEFCYTKQCLMETLRHSIEIEFFLCMARVAKDATDGVFDFSADGGFGYFNMLLPAFIEEHESNGEPGALQAAGVSAVVETVDDVKMRLRKSSDGEITFQMCEDGELVEEIILDQSDGTLSGRAANCFEFEGQQDCGQMTITANCDPTQFATNADCAVDFAAQYNGSFGDGRIDFSATGGEDPTFDLDFNFAGEEEEFGTFSACGIGRWAGDGIGCFKADSSGSFPAIPSAEEVWLADVPGCEAAAAADSVCFNENFNPETCDPTNPALCGCPFEPAAGATCAFTFNNIECCNITGATLQTQTGTVISQEEAGALFTEVNDTECPAADSTVTFQLPWDCLPEVGKSFTTIDLSTVDPTAFDECEALFQDLGETAAGESCEEQEAEAEGGAFAEDFGDLTSCTSDTDCLAGEKCDTFGGAGDGVCVVPPPSCTTSADCQPDEICEDIPELGGTVCVHEFDCTDDFECPPDATCVDNHCAF